MNKFLRRIEKQNNEQGMALVMVLLVIVVVSILGVSLMGLAASNVKMSSGERNNQSAYYIAESGATLIMNEVTKEVQAAYNTATNQSSFYMDVKSRLTNTTFSNEREITSFEQNFGEQPIAKVKVEKIYPTNDSNGEYKIISTGTINNRTRTVEQKFNIRWSVAFPHTAVFVDNKITVGSGGSIINGSIGTNSIENNAITLHDSGSIKSTDPTKSVQILVGPGGGQEVVNLSNFTNITALPEKISLDMKPFKATPPGAYTSPFGDIAVPTDGNVTINADKMFNNLPNTIKLNDLKLNNNNSLTLDIGANKIELFVNDLLLNNNSTLSIKGTGTLSIYVTGNLTIDNSAIKQDDVEKDSLIIYLKKSSDPAVPKTIKASSSNTGITASIFAEDATFQFTGGEFHGRFVTGGIVNIAGNNVIQGSLIANSLDITGSSSITFLPGYATLPLPDFKVFPLNPEPVREK
ncbi:PilX N-terminal domain-containing pilus assembly protein [Neobacillus sp. DY30]|uniref:DUF7305 domain-containing protein n=1 Tax=Neobacillus sp. DY30 TaxID=3047871 RepID=UPI0024C09E06|nr:PilX N-terminal domain-containing pilus assembly protein [Neobacillus sp. DY30]WHX99493.1 PilX N-terminal domain-containing pilus assembly protein [Neobacillus sp. DY30]